MKQILHIENLDCPVCAEALQSDLQKIKGVIFVAVDYVTQTITLETVDEKAVQRVIDIANKFEEVRVLDGGRYAMKSESHKKEWLQICISAVFFAVGILLGLWENYTAINVIKYLCFAVAYFSVGYPVLISTAKNVAKGRVFDENFLMTVASIGAVAIGEIAEGVLVMLLYQLGELLQSIAVGSSRKSVAQLMALKSDEATVIEDGALRLVAPEEIKVGDVLLIRAGEKAPVDGVLLDGVAVLDMKSLTGEAEPRTFKKEDEILSGSINVGGVYEMKAIRPYKDSAVAKILDMVENASAGKAKPEKFISKFAKIYTPIVCCLALAVLLCGPLLSALITDGSLYFKDFPRWVNSALSFLVISCPCALIISVPLTYFSGIGRCAKSGILVKGATYLDVAAGCKTVAFDKTGTLTEGNFTLLSVSTKNESEREEMLALAAAIEKNSAHPIAAAFVPFDNGCVAENVNEIAGQGLTAEINGEIVLVGNATLLKAHGVTFDEKESLNTLVYVAKSGKLLGITEIGDKLRDSAKSAILELKKLGVERSVMLTGDNLARARKIANEVGMYEVKAELLPNEKLDEAEKLKQNGGLLYVGDGINDAPVMSAADCAVSMGTLGSAAAVEASDMVLISDDLTALPKGIRIARKTKSIVKQNIVFSIGMKVVFMALGLLGWLPLWLAVFADVGVMLLAVLNSFRVRIAK